MAKIPFPGHCLVVVDEKDERDDEWNGGPQVGRVIAVNDVDKSLEIAKGSSMTFGDLVGKTVNWQQYAEANFTRFDKELNETVAFIDFKKIVGYEG